MSDTKTETTVHGMMAEFTSVDSLLDACNRVREAGYTKTDAYTPFPVHGIDKALGIKPTVLPWIALGGGLSGLAIALAMQIWMNTIDYPYIISGKPYLSLPAFMPVAFELTILLASFGAFFGMWALNGLPRFSNPIFTDPRFDRATDDRFFLYIDAKDERYNADGVKKLFDATGSQYINEVREDDSPKKVPRFIYMAWGLSVAFSVIPLLVVLKMRVTTSDEPRFHIFPDMDFSPSRDAQMTTSLFADSRAMRPDVPGTVARGQFDESVDTLTGIDMDKLKEIDAPRAERLISVYTQGASESDASTTPAATPAVMDTMPWLTKNPVTVDLELMERGQQQFNIYCAVCHGGDGKGNGLVNQRAQSIMADTWVPPASMHQDTLYSDKYPDGKLFSTISNGIRKMPGYASQIKLRDRWAIVAYVRALQKSQNATIDLVPADRKAEIENEVAAAEKAIEEAEAEAQAKAAAAAAEAAPKMNEAAEKPASGEKAAAEEKVAAEKAAADKAAAEKAAAEKAAADKAAAEKAAADKAAEEKAEETPAESAEPEAEPTEENAPETDEAAAEKTQDQVEEGASEDE